MAESRGGLRVVVAQGNLTEATEDAVVNAANDHLWMGGGVAGALKRAGGGEIEREAMAQGPIEVGGSVLTGAGRLPARHVIHAATMGQDLATSPRAVHLSTKSALELARRSSLSSIAFPALGTGVGSLSFEECALAMREAIEAHADSGTTLQLVRIVVVGEDAEGAFKRVFSESETRDTG